MGTLALITMEMILTIMIIKLKKIVQTTLLVIEIAKVREIIILIEIAIEIAIEKSRVMIDFIKIELEAMFNINKSYFINLIVRHKGENSSVICLM